MMLPELNTWIWAMLAKGDWVSVCLACGTWFAQPRLHPGKMHAKGYGGRRSFLCRRIACRNYWKYLNRHGRAPPEWMRRKWREEEEARQAAFEKRGAEC